MKVREGMRVRLVNAARIGTVEKVVRGNASDSVLVRWDEWDIDRNWNRFIASWEPSHCLTRFTY